MPIIFSEEIHKIKCKYGHGDKKCETCGNTYRVCDCFLQYTNFKDDLKKYNCLCCNKNYRKNFHEELKEQFFKTYKFSNHDKNKFF